MRSGASLGFLAGSLAMTLLNPWGYKLWLSTLALAADPYFTKLNQEWLPPGFSDPAFWPFLLSMILLALGLLGTRRSSLKRFDLMLLLPLLLLSLLHRRYLPFYAMLLPIPLTRMFPSHIFLRSLKAGDAPPVCTTILWGAMALSAILLGRLPMLEAHTSAFPPQLPSSELAEVLRSPGPVFHHPDIGGYIIWKGFPNLKAYIDDRNQLIGRERYEECFLVLRAEKGWEKILERWKIEWVLALRETPLIKTMETSEHWERRAYRPDSPWSLFHLKSNED
jgi:hypothetical protein